MKYKAGDKVRIKSLDWYNENKDEDGDVPGAFFSESRSRLCGTVQIIGNPGHQLASGSIIYSLKDQYEFIGEEAIEGLVEFTHDRLVEVAKDAWDKVDEEMEARYGKTRVHYDGEQWSTVFECPDGYIFKDENGNVINATKIVLENKNVLEKKSPKTDDIIKWLREHDMTKYIGVLYSGMCSITFDTEKLIKDITQMIGDE